MQAWFESLKADFELNFIQGRRWTYLVDGLGAVSYTHLDVYKRQATINSIIAFVVRIFGRFFDQKNRVMTRLMTRNPARK